MVHLLNIGNTNTQIAGLADGRPAAPAVVATDGLRAGTLPPCVGTALSGPCLVASVVPAVSARLRAAACAEVVFLHADLVCEVDFSGVDASTLGADRVANAVAAAVEIAGPALVLDCGTCVTTEAVDGARRFRGGAILPGRRLWRQALRDHTGQLPEIPLRFECPTALGTCTADAIAAGVDLGILGAVERLVAESRAKLGAPSCPVVVVGGDAGYFCRHLAGVTAGGADFTLRGLAHVAVRVFGQRRLV